MPLMSITDLLKITEATCVFLPLSSWHPQAHRGKHTVKRTETLIQDADGQADRQMDRGKERQICHWLLEVAATRTRPRQFWLSLQRKSSCGSEIWRYLLPAPLSLTSSQAATALPHPQRRPSPQEPGDSSRDQTGGRSRAGTRMPAHCQGLGASWHTVNRRTPSM